MDLPDYCCAILGTTDGRLLMEWRGPDARHAPGLITCFGGAREPGETPEACIRRELQEELGWCPDALALSVVLRVQGVLVAWFYRGSFSGTLESLHVLAGMRPILATRGELDALPLHPWHGAAIDAERSGKRLVVFSPSSQA